MQAETKARMSEWASKYNLVLWGDGVGKRCASRLTNRKHRHHSWGECPWHIESEIGDHGRFFRAKIGGMRLFIGQPYNLFSLESKHFEYITRLQSAGIHVLFGEYGKGWYNPNTYPVILSNEPIPNHHYEYEWSEL